MDGYKLNVPFTALLCFIRDRSRIDNREANGVSTETIYKLHCSSGATFFFEKKSCFERLKLCYLLLLFLFVSHRRCGRTSRKPHPAAAELCSSHTCVGCCAWPKLRTSTSTAITPILRGQCVDITCISVHIHLWYAAAPVDKTSPAAPVYDRTPKKL